MRRGKSRQSAPVVSVTPHPVESGAKILSFSVKLRHFLPSTLSAIRRNPHAIRSAVPRWSGKFKNIIVQDHWKPIHLLHRDLCALSSFRASDSYPNGRGCHHWRPSFWSVPVDGSEGSVIARPIMRIGKGSGRVVTVHVAGPSHANLSTVGHPLLPLRSADNDVSDSPNPPAIDTSAPSGFGASQTEFSLRHTALRDAAVAANGKCTSHPVDL